MPAERRFPVMGSAGHVVVTGPDRAAAAHADRAVARLAALEACWSRFRPDSEVSRLNARGGLPTALSPDAWALVSRSLEAWSRTGGRFDPTVHGAMVANGYDRDLGAVAADDPRPAAGRPSPGCAGIAVQADCRVVRLPAGAAVDPGGIGKGLAADLVVAELRAAGAPGALVDVGGDVRVAGAPPDRHGWIVAVEHPLAARGPAGGGVGGGDEPPDLVRLALDDGAVATSSVLRRRWRRAGAPVHHVVDPATGRPTGGDLVAVTVVAAEAWWAEALTKAVLVAGDLTPVRGAGALAVRADGTVLATPDLTGLVEAA